MSSSTLAIRLPLAALALVLVLQGCATAPPRAPSVLMGSENRVFLILPLNVATPMPRELEHFSAIVWKELELYLRNQEKQLKTISSKAARTLWLRMIRQLRAGGSAAAVGYEDAARALTLELRKHTDFDTMIAPSLFIQKARITNRSARWDGVAHELEIEARGLAARSLMAKPFEGLAPAASVHVVAFDPSGDRIHEGQGGLDVLVRVQVKAGDRADPNGPNPTFQFATRTDLFADRTRLREGINEAFVPFLPSLPD